MSEDLFLRASLASSPSESISILQTSAPTDMFLRLVLSRTLEESGDLDSAEASYFELLENFSSVGRPCPLGLYHYLGFVARTRGPTDALALFDDMLMAESEHVTPDLFPAVAVGIGWKYLQNIETVLGLFRKGIAYSKSTDSKKSTTSLVIELAEFLAFTANELKLAEFELAKHVALSPVSSLFSCWEKILVEFNADLKTLKAMHRMKSVNDPNAQDLVEDATTGIVTLSDFPPPKAQSIIVNLSQNAKNIPTPTPIPINASIQTLTEKIFSSNLAPSSSVLETFLGPNLAMAEAVDLHDGGDGPTNHVYRPDITKMLKFSPWDVVDRSGEVVPIPRQITNLNSMLPTNIPLKCANNQYIADQCIRLLVSISLPSRHVAEEMYANVDKRTRVALETREGRARPPVAAPTVATPEKKVKKEEVFDPVEFYNNS
jgi:hypothetical protein